MSTDLIMGGVFSCHRIDNSVSLWYYFFRRKNFFEISVTFVRGRSLIVEGGEKFGQDRRAL